ncbi:hypothetical protein TTHERM_00624500 (macronuclear) [Tetrahymena thermophila SB210]|uniref:Uncharacterized protein n=1 Tax=Tetrahymena thermophila (strain SB210) TaxID=312017 RepID=Q240T3_TETTS|nr:hypothetical protein TTHERM_00624500 [Tetrahymena thermophila SB210]EAS02331.1 hypothetical protein TTHERM_00624500 [Tetrahymena thermophila SB210]|eukprot:XP_001022576.1 hypothetical protein TTHERM_00624500 [Tetrahymena thermophila SB210]
MTRVSDSCNQQAELMIKNKIFIAIKKSIAKEGKDSMVFERIEEEDSIHSCSSTLNVEQSAMNAEPQQKEQQPKYNFKKPLDKSKVRKMNALALELNQLFAELKESAPIKRRRKMTIYNL